MNKKILWSLLSLLMIVTIGIVFFLTSGEGEKNKNDEILGEVQQEEGEKFSEIYTQTKEYIDKNNEIATIPKGFAVGISDKINTINKGLVITDAVDENGNSIGNEFVWIPITEELPFEAYREPFECIDINEATNTSYDSQESLDYYYGKDTFNYEKDFNYKSDYQEMIKAVNKYNGFFVGRYETTIDENKNIGSKYNTEILSIYKKLTYNSGDYSARWWGLYYEQKYADVTNNGVDVQTMMMSHNLWNKMTDYIELQRVAGNTEYDVNNPTEGWHRGEELAKSGQLNPGENGDVALNIWDLESNALEYTQGGTTDILYDVRFYRGGNYEGGKAKGFAPAMPSGGHGSIGSRLMMYIK